MSRLARKYNQQLKTAAELVRTTTTTDSLPKYRPKHSSTRVSSSMHMLKPGCDDNMEGLGSPEDVQENRTKHYKFSLDHPPGIGQSLSIISHYIISMSHVSIDTKALGILNLSSRRLDCRAETMARFRQGRSSSVAVLRWYLPRAPTAWAKETTSSKSSRQSMMMVSTRVAPQYMSSWKGKGEFMRWASV